MRISWIKMFVFTAFIPLIIALGYGLAYAFERGYCDIYRIPPELIELTVNNLLYNITTTIIILSVSGLIWYPYVYVPLRKLQKRWGNKLSYLTGGLLVVIILALLYQEVWVKWVPLLIVIVSMVTMLFLIPIIYNWFKKGLNWIKQKICNKPDEIQSENNQNIPIDKDTDPSRTDQITPRKLVFLVLSSIFILCAFTFFAGQAKAEMQEEFLVIDDPANSVILRIYGNKLICAPVDMKESQINGNLFIKRLDSITGIMELKTIGRLGQR